MIPLLVKMKIPRGTKRPLILWLPLFIVWLILFAILLLILPVLLIAVLFTWHRGYGKIIILSYPMLVAVLWNLQGLLIDVESKEDRIYMEFI
jgi:hypothetical protein